MTKIISKTGTDFKKESVLIIHLGYTSVCPKYIYIYIYIKYTHIYIKKRRHPLSR